MAEAWVCDRCSGVIKQEDDLRDLYFPSARIVDVFSKVADLCTDCHGDFVNFLAGASVHKQPWEE